MTSPFAFHLTCYPRISFYQSWPHPSHLRPTISDLFLIPPAFLLNPFPTILHQVILIRFLVSVFLSPLDSPSLSTWLTCLSPPLIFHPHRLFVNFHFFIPNPCSCLAFLSFFLSFFSPTDFATRCFSFFSLISLNKTFWYLFIFFPVCSFYLIFS